ncbi:MAG: hypothetical protein AAF488_10230 [Planctomycetota bacterium]
MRKNTKNRTWRAVATALVASFALLTGCGSAPEEKIEDKPLRGAMAETYDRIVLLRAGDERTDRHIGYLGEETVPFTSGRIGVAYWVYDLGFRKLGFYYPDGETYRVTSDGGSEKIGSFEPNRVFEMFFGREGTYGLQAGLR